MTPRTDEEIIECLFNNSIYDKETGCFLWNGAKSSNGYGVISYRARRWFVHRLAYHLDNPGEELDVILHSCDTRNCWRLNHLTNGTYLENIHDAVAKNRHAKGSRVGTSVLNTEQALEIKFSTLPSSVLAKQFNVTRENVWQIRTGRSWEHLNINESA